MTETTTAQNQAGNDAEPVNAEATAETVDTKTDEATDGDASEGDGEGSTEQTKNKEPWPDKAVNALKREKREKRQYRAQVRALEAQIAQLKGSNPAAEVQAPDPNKFEKYTDYVNEQVKFQTEQAVKEAQNKGRLEALEGQKEAVQAERNAELARVAQETAKAVPDLGQVIGAHAQALDSVGSEIGEIIYEMDNAPLAIYTLAKEGVLEDVLNAPPAIAAHYLLNAQARGEQALAAKSAHKPTPKQTVQAPEPIKAARGTGTSQKPYQLMSGKDVLKWVNS